MAFLEWDESFSVGNQVLDQQHQMLIALLSELHAAYEAGKAKESLSHVFESLLEYTELHFRTEEALFNATEYPGKAKHRQEHQRLLDQALEHKRDFDEGGKYIALETLQFISEWVQHHILETDSDYNDYI